MGSNILFYAIPGFIILMLLEIALDRYRGTGYYRFNDTFSSLTVGIVSRSAKLLVGVNVLYLANLWLEDKTLTHFSETNLWHWLLAFVLYDLAYYWFHRISHEVSFFWASHAVHHQSEEYNLSTALRQSSINIFGWIFYVPLLWLGVPWEMLITCGAYNLIYQYWVHTRHIGHLGWYESIFVTPSNHRVHHGQNDYCIDKNYGGVFILWDRLFGTYQVEQETVIYGVRYPLNSFDPVWANLHLWWAMAQDAWHTQSGWDKLRLWFMPTGWRPADVTQEHPRDYSDLGAFQKFDPESQKNTQLYAFFQLVAAIPMMLVFVFSMAELGPVSIWLMWLLITLPMISGAQLLVAGNPCREVYRIAISWLLLIPAYTMAPPLLTQLIAGYLVISSLLYWLLIKPKLSQH